MSMRHTRGVLGDADAGPMTLADLPAAAAAHLRACPSCRRFYARGLRGGGWVLADPAPAGAGAAPAPAPAACAACGQRDQQVCLSLTRRPERAHALADGRGEALRLAVCRACGHVEPLADTARAA
jgi:hypothetical protein